MTLTEIFTTLQQRGIRIWVEEGQLCFKAPPLALTPELRQTLIAHKADIIRFLHDIEAAHQLTAPAFTRVDRDGRLPLSFAQQRLWILDQLEPASPAYTIPSAIQLSGALNIAALTQSLKEIVRRHEVLRTTFAMVDGQPVQLIHPEPAFTLKLLDLCHSSRSDWLATVRQLAAQETLRPFDLAQGPLIRFYLLRQSADEHVLFCTVHHIVFDAVSLQIMIRELETLYAAFAAGQPAPLREFALQYADFAHWQRQWLRDEVLAKHLAYWKQQLAQLPALLPLPTDRPRTALQTFRGASYTLLLPSTLSEQLKTFSQQEGCTLFMTLLATFTVLLYRYSGQRDIVVGSPITNREQEEIQGLIGFFVNMLVLRNTLSGNLSFRELLRRVQQVTLAAYEHQLIPFEKLVEALQPERNLSYTPLFQVMFVLQSVPPGRLRLPQLTLRPLDIESYTAKFDLTLTISETDDGLAAAFEYNSDLFVAPTIQRMAQHFQRLLEEIVVHPEMRIAQLPLLTAAERQQLLLNWNNTAIAVPQDQVLHQRFEQQAAETPDAIALIGDQHLSYRVLNQRANQVARHLYSLGVGPERLVALCVDRSPAMVIGLLGILKAAAAYVPLDPTYPQERLAFMLADAEVAVLLTQASYMVSLPNHSTAVVCLDSDWERIATEADTDLHTDVAPANLAYVLYTSGSTGWPKGVQIEHRSAVGLVHWARHLFTPEQMAGVLASTSLCFDLSVFELFVPLSWGGTVILAENAVHLPTLAAASGITLLNTVPSAMQELLRSAVVPHAIRVINLAGEPLHADLVEQIYSHTATEAVFNLYGPSEATTYATAAAMPRNLTLAPSIGHPIANTQIYITDAALEPLPVGVPGEVLIGGIGLARGYLNRPDLSSERFIPNPFSSTPGSRLYRTGDLGRYRPDGSIEFLGRFDHQVKVRGFRIELGEIEATLRQHPAVRETVVLARELLPGDTRLVAYVVVEQPDAQTASSPPADQPQSTAFTPDATPISVELRMFVQQRLPAYMIPAAFVLLPALPLNANGKIDRNALPAPGQNWLASTASHIPPQTEMEQSIAAIWRELLHTERIGVHDNFFEIGGSSLLLIRMHSLLRTRIETDISVIDLFKYPTISTLAHYLTREHDQSGAAIQRVLSRSMQRKTALQQQKQQHRAKRASDA